MRLFESYERVAVISLPARTDRRQAIRRQIGDVEFFDAVRPSTPGPFSSIGHHGCYLSHLALLKPGKSVLILEDDCEFTGDCIVPADVDMLYGGWLEMDGDCVVGSHCVGLSARAAALAYAYLSGLIERRIGPDAKAAREPGFNPEILPPIDGAYVWFRRNHPEIKTLFAQISRQRRSRSDVTPGRLDTIPFVRSLIDFGRRVAQSSSS